MVIIKSLTPERVSSIDRGPGYTIALTMRKNADDTFTIERLLVSGKVK